MKKIIGFTFIILSVFLFSCKDEVVTPENDTFLSEKSAQLVLDEVEIEDAVTEVDYEIDFYSNAEPLLSQWLRMGNRWGWTNNLRYQVNHCPSVQIDNSAGSYPKTITLDYGDSTVLRNGKVLSGIIIIEISGPKSDVDYNRLVTYQDFGVDSLLINGTAEITLDREEDIFRTFTSNLIFTLPDGATIDRTSEREWQWIEGMDTEFDQTDDMIQITGFAEAVTSDGDVYRKDIVEPLIRTRDCRFIVQGLVVITLNNEFLASINYGDGECDNIATVMKDGQEYEIDLSTKQYKGNKTKGQNNARGHGNGNVNGSGNGNGGGNGNG